MATDPEQAADNPITQATYESLAQVELSFEDIDTQILSTQYNISLPTYQHRNSIIKSIPNFWPLVFEQSPTDIDQYLTPTDFDVFSKCLTNLEVTRFEVPSADQLPAPRAVEGEDGGTKMQDYGEPRSLCFKFEFSENEWFEDRTLVKKFWWRRAADGWAGRVSEPIKINWKKGMDLTNGLTDAAIALTDAYNAKRGEGKTLKGNRRDLPEYKTLQEKLDATAGGETSFFTFFAYRGRDIPATESALAHKKELEERAASKSKIKANANGTGADKTNPPEPQKQNQTTEDEEEKEEAEAEEYEAETEVEPFPSGEDLAIAIAEDLWPNATKYFTLAQEDGELDSDMEISDEDLEEDIDDDDDEGEKGKEVVVENIRELVKGRKIDDDAEGEGEGPVRKKRKN